MDKFEYKILNISRERLKSETFQEEVMGKLNEPGDESRELINIEGLNEVRFFGELAKRRTFCLSLSGRKIRNNVLHIGLQ